MTALNVGASALRCLQDPAAAMALARASMVDGAALVDQHVRALAILRATGHPARYQFARWQLLDYAAAAFMLGEQRPFTVAVDALLQHQLPGVPGRWQPTPADWGRDLHLALACGRAAAACVAGHGVLACFAAARTIEDYQAVITARVINGEAALAHAGVEGMRHAIAASDAADDVLQVARAWAGAACAVLSSDRLAFNAAIARHARCRTAVLDRALARWASGLISTLTTVEFWDAGMAALMAIARAQGMAPGDARHPYADLAWPRCNQRAGTGTCVQLA